MPPFEHAGTHSHSRFIRRTTVAVAARRGARVIAIILGAVSASAVAQSTPTVRKQADFNGDGYADIAIGAPGETVWYQSSPTSGQNVYGAGVVHVVYGTGGGLVPQGHTQLLSRVTWDANPYNPYPPTQSANFGTALAWGDFNRDGYDDLAIGVPGDNSHSGRVDLYTGGPNGLSKSVIWEAFMIQNRPPEQSGQFGIELGSGDLNGDGYADLAISQYLTANAQRGAVYVLYGTSWGLGTRDNDLLYYFDWYGPTSLACADFNGDRCDDLAMGLPYHDSSSGAVLVEYGSVNGLSGYPEMWDQNYPDLPGIVEDQDRFGYSLASADFNADGYWDLAIGVPGENSQSGIAHVVFGQSTGLELWANQIWSQDNPDVDSKAETRDMFGASLVAGNFNGDPYPALAVGVPGENNGAGIVHVLTIIAGAHSNGHQVWSQDSPDILGGSEENDRFGSSLVVGNFDGSGSDDLAIGVPGEAHGENAEIYNAGAVNVLFGNLGLQSGYNQILMQGFQGMQETGEAYDRFGSL